MELTLPRLIDLMRPERLELNLFRAASVDIGSGRVFGGQVLAQALASAYETVEERRVHSLHAYFLRAGDLETPIVYDVDRARDGGSFSMRRVVAIQHGQPIFNLAASFQKREQGLDHQMEMPDVPPPESLPDGVALGLADKAHTPPMVRLFYEAQRPFEFRMVQAENLDHPEPLAPVKQVWFRTVKGLPDDDALHRVLLAYVSDYHLVTTAMLPHGVSYRGGNVQVASLDHGMWFHCDFRMDDWMLYSMDSPRASGGRGYARGSIFRRDGTLVASTCQEGVIRIWPEKKG